MKKFKLFAFAILAGLVMTVNVDAAEVGTSEELLSCLSNSGICTLTSNIDLEERFVVESGKNVVLDLNGKTLNVEYITDNYSIFVKSNASLTVQGNGTMNIANEFGFGVVGTLTVKNGTFNQSTGDYMIGSWGTTTIENGTFNGDYCAVNSFSGNTVIKNGAFNTKPYKFEDEGPAFYDGILVDTEAGATLKVEKGTFNQVLSWPNVLADNAEVTYNLVAENVLYDPVEIKGNVTLNLNGYNVTYDATSIDEGEDSLFTVLRGGKLTINDSKGTGKIGLNDERIFTPVKMTKYGETAEGAVAELVVNGGILEGYSYGISGNGNRHNTKVTINGGKVEGLNGTGIFQPQVGEVNINGGTITGKTGIEMRSGTLNVKGGTIIGTYKPLETEANGNGTTNKGAGIAVAQHTTKKAITINVSGGTVQGYYALYESDPQNNNLSNMIKLNITGGKFETINEGTVAVYSENHTEFLTGGTYSSEPKAEYVKAPFVAKKDGSVYVIGVDSEEVSTDSTEVDTEKEVEEVTAGVAKDDKEVIDNVLLDSLDANKELVEGKTEEIEVKLEVSNLKEEDVNKTLKDYKEKLEENVEVLGYFDANVNVYAGGQKVGSIDELTDEITLTFLLPKGLKEVEKGHKRVFVVLREHDGKVEELEAQLSEDGKYVTVKTDRFSTYALAYEDVEDVTPPKTGDNIVTTIAISVISIVALAAMGLFLKKRFN